jgi:hypothetical protein
MVLQMRSSIEELCETRTAALALSLVGLHWSLVRDTCIIGELEICSRVCTSLNWAYGLFAECAWLTRAISAKSLASAPYFSICSLPAFAKYCAFGGVLPTPQVSFIIFISIRYVSSNPSLYTSFHYYDSHVTRFYSPSYLLLANLSDNMCPPKCTSPSFVAGLSSQTFHQSRRRSFL